MAMQLGSYTFTQNPCEPMPVITEERRAESIKTLGGVAFFSWGTFIAGQEVPLNWTSMPTAQYTQLLSLLNADVQLVWDPENGSTYNVEILSLSGDYHLDASAGAAYRKNVIMTLLIISEVA